MICLSKVDVYVGDKIEIRTNLEVVRTKSASQFCPDESEISILSPTYKYISYKRELVDNYKS